MSTGFQIHIYYIIFIEIVKGEDGDMVGIALRPIIRKEIHETGV